MSANQNNRNLTSPLWQIFKRIAPGLAKCCICRKILSFKSSNTNLRRHLVSKHYGVIDNILGRPSPKGYVYKVNETPITKLIALVETNPCLWDTRCDSFGNVQLQQEAWNRIASELHPTEEQSEVVSKLSEQFNTLRNRYFSSRRCGFVRELSFMAPLIEGRNQEMLLISLDQESSKTKNRDELTDESTLKDDLVEQGCDDLLTNEINISEVDQNPKEQAKLKNALVASTECNLQLNNTNEDSLFLLSLANEISKVPAEFEMSFKAELLAAFSVLLKKCEDKTK